MKQGKKYTDNVMSKEEYRAMKLSKKRGKNKRKKKK